MTTPKEIPAFRLVAQPMTAEAAALPGFRWAAKGVGARHQLGGQPTLIHAVEFPQCDDCKKQMTFYGQLDSINDEFVIGDVGMVFVFVCFDCLAAKAVLQTS